MARYEYYDNPSTNGVLSTSGQRLGQTFTIGTVAPNIFIDLSYVRLRLSRVSNPGIVYVYLYRANSNHHPYGNPVSTASFYSSSLPYYENNIARMYGPIYMSSYTLIPSTRYALVVFADNLSSSRKLHIGQKYTSGAYAGGTKIYSSDNGAYWSTQSNSDLSFEIWGTPTYDPLQITNATATLIGPYQVQFDLTWTGGITPYTIELEAGDGDVEYIEGILTKSYSVIHTYPSAGDYHGAISVYCPIDGTSISFDISIPAPQGFLDIINVNTPSSAHYGELVNFNINTQNNGGEDNFKIELTGDLVGSQEFSLGEGLTNNFPFSFTMPSQDVIFEINTYHLE